MINIIDWVTSHWTNIIEFYFILVGIASWIVKVFPTLKAGNKFLGILKFIGKYIAVDKYGPAEVKRPE
jgi:hypothetical protein